MEQGNSWHHVTLAKEPSRFMLHQVNPLLMCVSVTARLDHLAFLHPHLYCESKHVVRTSVEFLSLIIITDSKCAVKCAMIQSMLSVTIPNPMFFVRT